MKKVSRRALFALALAAVLAVGTLAFCVKYAANAEKWVTFSGMPVRSLFFTLKASSPYSARP